MRVVASAISDRGLKREGNEDQYLIDESLGLYIVCDGLGGHAAGEVAAERAIRFAVEYIANNRQAFDAAARTPDGHFRTLKVVEEAVRVASKEVYRLSRSSPEYAGMGTTMTLLMIIDGKAITAHVGDSRLYVLRAGELHQLTVDHTIANEMLLAGELSKEEAANSQYQHVLTRSIGPHEFVTVDTLLFDLLPSDRLLLCSDGLSNYFADRSVAAELLSRPTIIEDPKPLIEFAKQAGGSDNITAVVLEAMPDDGSPPPLDAEERMDALRHSFLGRKLSVRRLMHLLTTTTVIHCSAGKELIKIGEECPGLVVVLQGSFRVLDDTALESELTTSDCFGDATLFAPAKSPASLVANEASRALLIDREKFNRLTRRMPRLGNILLRNLSRQLSQQIIMSEARPISLDDTGPFA